MFYNHAINKFDKESNYKSKNKNSLIGALALDLQNNAQTKV